MTADVNLKKVALIKNEIEQIVYQFSGMVNDQNNRVKIADVVYRAMLAHGASSAIDGFSSEVNPSGFVRTVLNIKDSTYHHSMDLKSFMTSDKSRNKLYNDPVPASFEPRELLEVVQEDPVEDNRVVAYEHAMSIIGKTSY